MVILFLADGFEEIEALSPLDLLRRANIEVVTVGLGKKDLTGAHGITVMADTDDAHLPTGPYEMVILPGGMPGASNLDASAVVDHVLRETAAQGGYLAAICAAPMVLGHRGYLAGKRAICFPGFESELRDAIVTPYDTGVVCDGNVITARGMGVAQAFGLSLVAALRGEAAAEQLKSAILA